MDVASLEAFPAPNGNETTEEGGRMKSAETNDREDGSWDATMTNEAAPPHPQVDEKKEDQDYLADDDQHRQDSDYSADNDQNYQDNDYAADSDLNKQDTDNVADDDQTKKQGVTVAKEIVEDKHKEHEKGKVDTRHVTAIDIPRDDTVKIYVEEDSDVQNDKISSKVTTVSFASEVEILNEDEFAEADFSDTEKDNNCVEAVEQPINQDTGCTDDSYLARLGGDTEDKDAPSEEPVAGGDARDENPEKLVTTQEETEDEKIITRASKDESDSCSVCETPLNNINEDIHVSEGKDRQEMPESSDHTPEMRIHEAAQLPDSEDVTREESENKSNTSAVAEENPTDMSNVDEEIIDNEHIKTDECESKDLTCSPTEEPQENQEEPEENQEELGEGGIEYRVIPLQEVEREHPEVIMMEPLRRMQAAAAPVVEAHEQVLEVQVSELEKGIPRHVDEHNEESNPVALEGTVGEHTEEEHFAEQNTQEVVQPIKIRHETEVSSPQAILELERDRIDAVPSPVLLVEVSSECEELEEPKRSDHDQEIDAVLAAQPNVLHAIHEDHAPCEAEASGEDPRQEDQYEFKGNEDMLPADDDIGGNEGTYREVQGNIERDAPLESQKMQTTSSEHDSSLLNNNNVEPLPPIDAEPDHRLMEGLGPVEIYPHVNPGPTQMRMPSSRKLGEQVMSSRSASKLDSISRATSLSRVQIARIPSPPATLKAQFLAEEERRASSRLSSSRLPPSLMRMSSVMVSARKKAVKDRQASVYYEERQHQKVITLDEAINSRPPMPFDLDNPGPWHYTPRNQPLYEDNAPEWTFGMKFPERGGGGRTAYGKTWFNSPNNFTTKTRFERRWPSPNAYSPRKSLIGRKVPGKREYPSFSIGVKTNFCINKKGSEHEPGPDHYERQKSDPVIFRRAPAFSMAARLDRRRLFGAPEITPAPNYYHPRIAYSSRKTTFPAFTISGVRKPKCHALGPHATL